MNSPCLIAELDLLVLWAAAMQRTLGSSVLEVCRIGDSYIIRAYSLCLQDHLVADWILKVCGCGGVDPLEI